MKAVAVGCENNLDPNCVKHVREFQGKVRREECERAGELSPRNGAPLGTLGSVAGAVAVGH